MSFFFNEKQNGARPQDINGSYKVLTGLYNSHHAQAEDFKSSASKV